jgi:8-oxo-dGTP pyrophosphatase MutT (NUDIX family)
MSLAHFFHIQEERNAVNVAVLTSENQWLVFETHKYAIPGKTLSPVGGFINNGETPWEAARREIWEELGVGSAVTKADMERGKELQESKESKGIPFGVENGAKVPVDEHGLAKGNVPETEPDWTFLGRYRTMANRGGGFLYAYFLKNAVPLVEGGGSSAFSSHGDAESQKFMSLNNVEMKKALENGDFQEVKWALTHSLALQHQQSAMET